MITRQFLQEFYKNDWFSDCVQYLDDTFFEPAPKVIIPKTKSLIERCMNEKSFRKKRSLMVCTTEFEKHWQEVSLEISREIELDLIQKIKVKNETDGRVEKARQFPINEILEFKGGFARCPWHNERTPSLHFISQGNVAFCFGACSRSYDAIDAYMLVHACSFQEALKELSK